MQIKPRDAVNVAVLVLALIGVCTIGLGAYLLLDDVVEAETVREWSPSVSAAIAAASLLLTAYTYNRATLRQRRAATMEAWEKWQSGTRKLRRELLDGESPDAIGDAEATMLLELRRRTEKSAPDDETKSQIKRVHDITTVLNGLERLAAGCSSGLYDRQEISRIGRTIIVRLYDRFANFIAAARNDAGPKGNLKQPRAYVELENLHTWLTSRH